MKAIFTLLFLVAAHAHALTAEEIQEIAKKPHDRKNLVEALKIYPEARKYKMTQKSGPNMNELHEAPGIVAMEKTVEGKYIVTETDLGKTVDGDAVRFIMVVHHDPVRDVLLKWILGPDGKVGLMTGIADSDRGVIAWAGDAQFGAQVLTYETHRAKQSTWREVIMNDGKIQTIVQGVAEKLE